jgi:hypothetical protein
MNQSVNQDYYFGPEFLTVSQNIHGRLESGYELPLHCVVLQQLGEAASRPRWLLLDIALPQDCSNS